MKSNFLTVLFLLILILSLVIRIGKIDYPFSFGFAWGDGTRDYLVANHILKYQEFPLLGPFNLLYNNGVYGSPLYFYLLALMLFPFNSILTLSIFNILLQLVVVVLIYLISKNLFGLPTAAVALVFFSFNKEVLHHSDFIWQPYLMQPIIYLALLFLVHTLLQKANFKLFLSLFLLTIAITLHSSAFPWLPVFLLVSTLILKRDHKAPKYYLGAILTFVLSIMIFYFPVAVYKQEELNKISFTKKQIYVQSISQYFTNFLSNSKELLTAFGLQFQEVPLFVLIIMSVWYFFKIKDNANQKKLTFLILILVLLPIIFASFFNKLRLHYLILSMGTLTIFAAKIASSFSKFNFILSFLLFLFFFKVFSSDFAFLKDHKRPLVDYKLIEGVTDNIKNELAFIQKKGGFSDFSFFQVLSFAKTKDVFYYPVLDTILLLPLEDKLNQKLVKVSDNSPYNHVQIGDNQYLLVACYQVECLKVFTRRHPQYAILKKLYESNRISVYLAKLHV